MHFSNDLGQDTSYHSPQSNSAAYTRHLGGWSRKSHWINFVFSGFFNYVKIPVKIPINLARDETKVGFTSRCSPRAWTSSTSSQRRKE